MLDNFEQHCWPVLQVASICYTCQCWLKCWPKCFQVIANRTNMLAEMLAKMLAEMLARFAPAFRVLFNKINNIKEISLSQKLSTSIKINLLDFLTLRITKFK